ncbi:MAG: hypothetical protein ACKO3G_06770 [Planctomycetaceae bacterium]
MPKKPPIKPPAHPRSAPAAEAESDRPVAAAALAQAELLDALARLVLAAVEHEAAEGGRRPARRARPGRGTRRG